MKSNIPLLNGGNFVYWKTKLKAVLMRDELWDVVSAEKPTPVTDAWTKKNNKAMAYIILSVEDGQLIHIQHTEEAYEAWQALLKKYERSTFGSRLYLRRKLYGIHYKNGSMSDHIDSIMHVVGLLRGSGKPLDDEEVVAVLLVSLPESYSGLVTALEGRDEKDLSVEYVTGKILDEHQRRAEASVSNGNSNGDSEVAMRSTSSVKDSHRHNKNKSVFRGGKSEKNNKGRKETRSCFYCNKPGHLKGDCRKYKAMLEARTTNEETARTSVENDRFIAFKTSVCADNLTGWCVDSGASSHMTNDKRFFSSIRTMKSSVSTADGSKVSVEGVGEGHLLCAIPGGKQKVKLKGVLYVPELDDSLMSVKCIAEKGYKVVFEGNQCKVLNGQGVVAEAEHDGSLYRLCLADPRAAAYSAKEKVPLHLWHRRLGHRDPAAIENLINRELATGIQISRCSEKITCIDCIKSKLTRSKFLENQKRETEPIRLVHSDLCGPMQTTTPSGNRYFLTLIDDYSRFTVVRLLRTKEEAAGAVKDYIAAMGARFGRKPMALRTDNGREYLSKDLIEFLRKEGVEQQFTVPYSPQQNGVAERKNRSLVETAKSMLLDANLDKRFWGEAILTATYLQNRMVSRSIEKTPIELFTGHKPDLSHIRVFGSRVFSLIPKEKRQKWDSKAEEGVLIGYHGNKAGYRILDPHTDKVWVSRSVEIIETTVKPEGTSKRKDDSSTTLTPKTSDVTTTTQYTTFDESDQPEGVTDVIERHPGPEVDEQDVEEKFQGAQMPQRRVSARSNKNMPPLRLTYKACTEIWEEPKNWSEMMQIEPRERKLWLRAAEEEMKSLYQHQVWELAELPPGKKAISCKWVFKRKRDGDGRISTYKARLVARGYAQRYGEDFDETFAPVVKHETVRVLFAIAAQKGLHVRQLDVKSAYLNGELDEIIFMEQPEGFVDHDNEDKVLRLKKSLYGLKQSARVWNKTATNILSKMAFTQGKGDPCLYSRTEKNGNITYVLLYVDDLLIFGDLPETTSRVSKQLQSHFNVKDMGDVNHYLGIQVERDTDGSFLLNQKAKIAKILADYGLSEPKPAAIPMEPGFLTVSVEETTSLPNNHAYRQLIGSLLYLATVSRPDIAAAVGLLCRKVEKPTEYDWKAAKRVLRYLAYTMERRLRLPSSGDSQLTCYVDADWAGDKTDRKSTSGYVFLLGGGAVAWSSRKQTAVATSSTEAEYIAASFACKELLWIRQLLTDMQIPVSKPTVVYEDNQGCIRLISGRSGARTKHIDVSYHQIRDLLERKVIDVQYCPTNQMLADIFTKPLAKEKFLIFTESLGLHSYKNATARGGVGESA